MSRENLDSLASKAGIKVPEAHIEDFRILLAGLDQTAQYVLGLDEYILEAGFELYPRTETHVLVDTD